MACSERALWVLSCSWPCNKAQRKDKLLIFRSVLGENQTFKDISQGLGGEKQWRGQEVTPGSQIREDPGETRIQCWDACRRRIFQKEAAVFSLEVVKFGVCQRSLQEDPEDRGMRRGGGTWAQKVTAFRKCPALQLTVEAVSSALTSWGAPRVTSKREEVLLGAQERKQGQLLASQDLLTI